MQADNVPDFVDVEQISKFNTKEQQQVQKSNNKSQLNWDFLDYSIVKTQTNVEFLLT